VSNITLKKKRVRKDPTEKKVSSSLQSLEMFRQGHPIAEIATTRNVTEGTVAGHLTDFIVTGEIAVHDLVPREKIDRISSVVAEVGAEPLGRIKSKLGNDYGFMEIKAVVQHLRFLERSSAGEETKS
jgi:uncharacterized protein YpbB